MVRVELISEVFQTRAAPLDLLVLILVFAPLLSSGQKFSNKPTFWDNWWLGGNTGLTSFYGDLSIHDGNLISKFSHESGPGISITGTKHIKEDRYAVCGQILVGAFGAATRNQEFNATVYEYNVHGSIDVFKLLSVLPKKRYRFHAFAGIGHFFFKTESKWIRKDIPPPPGADRIEIQTTIPEFVYFFGGMGSYAIKERLKITADMAIRQAHNDKLDTKNDKPPNMTWDYYLYTSAGITYNITFKKKRPSTKDWEDPYQMPWRP